MQRDPQTNNVFGATEQHLDEKEGECEDSAGGTEPEAPQDLFTGFGGRIALVAVVYVLFFLVLKLIDSHVHGFGGFDELQWTGFTWLRVFFAASGVYFLVWAMKRSKGPLSLWEWCALLAFTVMGIVSLLVVLARHLN